MELVGTMKKKEANSNLILCWFCHLNLPPPKKEEEKCLCNTFVLCLCMFLSDIM